MANNPSSFKSSTIIQDFKANKRCISMLIMPNRLTGGLIHQDFDYILWGKTYVFPHRYHITSNQGQTSNSALATTITLKHKRKRKTFSN